MSDLTKQFESLLKDMNRWDVYQEGDEIDNAMLDLKDKIDEAEKRIECARRCASHIYETIIKYTEAVDTNGVLEMRVADHDAIRTGSDDIGTALDFEDTLSIEDNWYNLYNEANGKQIDYFKITSHTNKEFEGKTFDVLHSDINENGHRILELNCPHPEDSNTNLWVNMKLDGVVVETKEVLPVMSDNTKEVIAKLEDVDGETLEHIIEQVGMTDQMVKQLHTDKIAHTLQIEIFNELDPIKKERTESDAYIVIGIDSFQWTYSHLRLIVDGNEFDLPRLGKESIYYDGKVWGDFRVSAYDPTCKYLKQLDRNQVIPKELLILFEKDLVD